MIQLSYVESSIEHSLKGKYHCTVVDLLFISLDSAALLMLNEQQFYLVKCKPVKQEVSRTLISPLW